MSGWINLRDKMPESESEVLVTLKDGSNVGGCSLIGNQVFKAMFIDDDAVDEAWAPFFWVCGENSDRKFRDEIIAWMPLPEPYEEGVNVTD